MVIGFKEQFKETILKGSKIHTIREDKSNRWRAGRVMHMATGVRTKKYDCFKEAKCIKVQNIKIKHVTLYNPNDVVVYIDGVCAGRYTNGYADGYLRVLARNDGFNSVGEFLNFFKNDFTGKIIHWTDFKYESQTN